MIWERAELDRLTDAYVVDVRLSTPDEAYQGWSLVRQAGVVEKDVSDGWIQLLATNSGQSKICQLRPSFTPPQHYTP